eukprot:COSAG06_NODE_3786_length_4902_cov_63.304809_2_plen_295_part_00
MQHRQHRQRRSRVMRRSRVIFDRQRPSVVDLRCPPAAVGRSEALCTNRPYSVDLRSALKQTRRSRVVLGASQICADLGSCGTAAPGNADFGSSPVSMRRFRGSPSAGAEQRRSGVSFARRADLGSFLRICADPGFIPFFLSRSSIVRKAKSSTPRVNGGSNRARGASTRRGSPPSRGRPSKPQRQFSLSTVVSTMQQTPRAAHKHTPRAQRRKFLIPHIRLLLVDKLPRPVWPVASSSVSRVQRAPISCHSIPLMVPLQHGEQRRNPCPSARGALRALPAHRRLFRCRRSTGGR